MFFSSRGYVRGKVAHAALLFFLHGLMLVGSCAAQAQGSPSASRIEHAEKEPSNWLTFYGNYGGWSFSSLNQITRENVSHLVPVRALSVGSTQSNASLRQGLEAAPLAVDGVLYVVGMQNNVYAFAAATGKPLWKYVYQWPQQGAPPGQRGSRGLAIGDGRIYMGTQDNHVLALDARTGRQIWNVKVEDTAKCHCGITSPPLFVRGKVIAGVAGGTLGHVRGYLNAFDARTGKLIWHFDTVASPDQPGGNTWTGDAWKSGGGATWYTGTYDPELNLIYWGTGDPSPTYEQAKRPGSNLYTSSLLALDADSGQLRWYFQETPQNVYDYDSAAEAVILDLKVASNTRKVLLHPSKNGFAYLLDRATGQFLGAFPYGSPNWTKSLGENGQPTKPVMPDSEKTFLLCPSMVSGARGIDHSAYSPRTGWWYTSDFEICSYLKGENGIPQELPNPNVPPNISAFDPSSGRKQWTFNTKYVIVSSLLATAGDLIFAGDLEGNAFALDARTGEKLWSFDTHGPIVSPPISFSIDGQQYIAISTGGGSITETFVPQLWPESRSRIPPPTSKLFIFALRESR